MKNLPGGDQNGGHFFIVFWIKLGGFWRRFGANLPQTVQHKRPLIVISEASAEMTLLDYRFEPNLDYDVENHDFDNEYLSFDVENRNLVFKIP